MAAILTRAPGWVKEDATEQEKGGLKTTDRDTSVDGKPRFGLLVLPDHKCTTIDGVLGRLQKVRE